MALPIDNGGKTENYIWQQTAYDITVLFSHHQEKTNKKDIQLTLTPEKLCFKIKNEIIYEGTFTFAIKCESSTWYIDDGFIVVELDKFKKHEWWKSAFQGDEEIDTSKVVPATETFSDLDSSTRSTIDKMMYEQKIKEQMKTT